jgi:hypothetical protein
VGVLGEGLAAAVAGEGLLSSMAHCKSFLLIGNVRGKHVYFKYSQEHEVPYLYVFLSFFYNTVR